MRSIAASYTSAYVDGDAGAPVDARRRQWNADLTVRHTFNEKYTVYADVLNVLDIEPEFDPSAAYGSVRLQPRLGWPEHHGPLLPRRREARPLIEVS